MMSDWLNKLTSFSTIQTKKKEKETIENKTNCGLLACMFFSA